MQVSGQFEINLPQREVFEFVSTPDLLAQCIPGLSSLADIGSNSYSAVLEVEVAFLKLKFDVTVNLAEVDSPIHLKATIDGKPKALAGKLTAVAELHLSETEDARTVVEYTLDQSMTGKLGGIGQSVFRAKCTEMADVFASNLRKTLEASREVLS